jgi:general stress protein 26
MIQLTDEMKQAIDGSLAERVPMVFASVDAEGQPRLGYMGSVHVHSDDQLAIWLRKVDSVSVANLRGNPKVSLLYRNPDKRLSWQFQGRAHVVDDDVALRQRVYDETPEIERKTDLKMLGHAVVIDLDRVIYRGEAIMER